MRKRKSTLPRPVQEQLNRIVAPAATAITVTLHEDHIEVIRGYHKTKAAYDQAVTTANAHTEDGMWTMEDLFAVEEALKALQVSQIEMTTVFASLARQAGL